MPPALSKITARLAPVDLVADLSALPPAERAALAKLVQAAQVMDPLFLRQVWAGNETVLLDLLAATHTPLGQVRLRAFLQNKGPWLRLEDERPFLPGIGDKPAAGNFYPAGATRKEIETWMNGLPGRGAGGRQGLLHHHPPRARRQVAGGALQPGIPGRAGAGPRICCARRRP